MHRPAVLARIASVPSSSRVAASLIWHCRVKVLLLWPNRSPEAGKPVVNSF